MTPIYTLGDKPKRNLYEEAKARGLAFNKQIEEDARKERLAAKLGKKPEVAKIQAPQKADMKGFIYVPSINLYMAKERTLKGESWNETHKLLQKENKFMPTIYQFTEYLKYLRTDYQDREEAEQILDDILTVRDPWRAEWLDAKFEKRKNGLYLLSDHKIENGKLKANYQAPLEDCLIKDKTPGIDLESYLKTANSQGLPSKNTKNGKLYFYYPRAGSVAWFGVDSDDANLNCDGDGPNDAYGCLGVRRAFKGEIK